MSWCTDRGIAYSVFLGRVVRPAEPTWLPADVELVRAVLAERRLTCPDCHTRDDEWGWRDAAGMFHLHPGDPPYEETTRTCEGCRRMEMRGKQADAQAPGVTVRWKSWRRRRGR